MASGLRDTCDWKRGCLFDERGLEDQKALNENPGGEYANIYCISSTGSKARHKCPQKAIYIGGRFMCWQKHCSLPFDLCSVSCIRKYQEKNKDVKKAYSVEFALEERSLNFA